MKVATLKLHFFLQHQQLYINHLFKISVYKITCDEATFLSLKVFRSIEAWLMISENFMLW